MFSKSVPQHFKVILVIVLCCTNAMAFCQDNLKAIRTSFDQYRSNALQEKIFVHTDKNCYMTGEIIWFKLYDVDASFHKPLSLSKVVYVEILDTSSKPILHAKIALNKGKGNGSFYLSQSVNSGIYKLRAYTNWMKNFDADYFFEKNITLINLQKMPVLITDSSRPEFDIQFFPEGGDMINNLPCKIAFKATDKTGKAVDFTGHIIDNKDTLISFHPYHAGMGHFMFTPQSDHIYKAVISTVDGRNITKDLPAIYSSGHTMNVTDAEGKIKVTVQTNIASAKEVYVFVHTRGSVKKAAAATLRDGQALFEMDRSQLDDGISQFTVFNEQKQPVCERLYFKKPVHDLQLSVIADQPVYALRSKVAVDIFSEDTMLQDETTSLSFSAYMLDSLQNVDSYTIETYLLLSSDLQGSIEDPAYYFTAPEKEAAIAADDLMLTNGWRRFKWKDVVTNQKTYFTFVPEVDGHIVTGKVVNAKTGTPQKYIEAFLSAPASNTQFSSSISDVNGFVKFEMKNFFGGTSIVAQSNTLTDTMNRVEIDDPFSNNYSGKKMPLLQRPVRFPNTLLEKNIGMQVQNIYTADKQKQFILPAYADTSSFYVNPDLKYLLDDYTRFTSMEEVLREYVALVNVARKGGRVYLPVVNEPQKTFFTTDPLVLIDGVPVFNFNQFLQFDPLKMKSLDVMTRRYLLGNSVFEGILNWKTYSPGLSNYHFNPNVVVMDYEGLQLQREFYTPSYNTPESITSHMPDFRNVLIWKSDIKLNGNNKTSLDFYTSDLPGNYAIVVQGIATNGVSGSKVITFDVKK